MSKEGAFDCFGEDSDSEDQQESGSPIRKPQKRDPECGVCVFHAGTEQALLHFVQQEVEGQDIKSSRVLQAVDKFCMTRHWMMHIGSDKGKVLRDFLAEFTASGPDPSKTVNIVELGTYCGYSSILISQTLKELHVNFHVWSVEVEEHNVKVAESMIKLAGLDNEISVLRLDIGDITLDGILRTKLQEADTVNFLFLDHDKPRYLADLQLLENNGLIKKGCHVAADNVVFHGIDDYRHYMKQHASNGVVTTRLEEGLIEYCEPDHEGDLAKKRAMKDGIELSVYQKDP